jgi:hypothetical protein
MAVDERPKVAEPPRATDFHNHVWEVQRKLIEKYPEAQFELTEGPDDAFHLKVYTEETSLWAPIEAVEDMLIDLQLEDHIDLHVIPLMLSQWEGPRVPKDYRASRSTDRSSQNGLH